MERYFSAILNVRVSSPTCPSLINSQNTKQPVLKEGPKPAASTAPVRTAGSRAPPRPTDSDTLGVPPTSLHIHKPPGESDPCSLNQGTRVCYQDRGSDGYKPCLRSLHSLNTTWKNVYTQKAVSTFFSFVSFLYLEYQSKIPGSHSDEQLGYKCMSMDINSEILAGV